MNAMGMEMCITILFIVSASVAWLLLTGFGAVVVVEAGLRGEGIAPVSWFVMKLILTGIGSTVILFGAAALGIGVIGK